MPTYEYECTICGHTFEEFQNMSDKPLSKCPKCGKKVKRLIGGGIGIIFKGSGFYVTDNKKGSSGSNGNGAKNEKTEEKKPAETSGTSGTEKSEKKEKGDSKKKEKQSA